VVGSSNRFVLQEIDDGGIFLPTVYQRGAPGTFKPGKYIIGTLHSNRFFFCSGSHCISVPLENGARVLREFKITFDSGEEGPKKARVSETGSGVLTRVRFLHCVH